MSLKRLHADNTKRKEHDLLSWSTFELSPVSPWLEGKGKNGTDFALLRNIPRPQCAPTHSDTRRGSEREGKTEERQKS